MSKFQVFKDEPELWNAKINFKDNNIDTNKNSSSKDFHQQEEFKQSTFSEQSSNNLINQITIRLEFIGNYFNVELEDIHKKLIQSIIPLKKEFHILAENKPDLYGPFWIYTTLIFIVVVSSNISSFLNVFIFLNYHIFSNYNKYS